MLHTRTVLINLLHPLTLSSMQQQQQLETLKLRVHACILLANEPRPPKGNLTQECQIFSTRCTSRESKSYRSDERQVSVKM